MPHPADRAFPGLSARRGATLPLSWNTYLRNTGMWWRTFEPHCRLFCKLL